MPFSRKGHKPTSEIKTFESNVKQKGFDDGKREKMIPVYDTFLQSIMTLKCSLSAS